MTSSQIIVVFSPVARCGRAPVAREVGSQQNDLIRRARDRISPAAPRRELPRVVRRDRGAKEIVPGADAGGILDRK